MEAATLHDFDRRECAVSEFPHPDGCWAPKPVGDVRVRAGGSAIGALLAFVLPLGPGVSCEDLAQRK